MLRLLAGQLTPLETTVATQAVASSLGGEVPECFSFASPRRALLVEEATGGDEDEWVLHAIMEALDEANTEAYPSDPVLVAPCCEQPTLLTEEIAIAAVEEARCNVIDEYGLRQPVEELPLDDWEPSQAVPVVNALIDGAPFDWGWDASSVVALDGVVDEDLRADLLSLLAGPDYAADAERGADPQIWQDGVFSDTMQNRAVGAGLGLDPSCLEELCAGPPDGASPPPVLRLQARLAKLVRAANEERVDVCRMPQSCLGEEVTPLAANAPKASDGAECYGWHIDADPALLPPSPWTDCYGRYPNRAPGKPRFVSALVYLSKEWQWPDWGAPTEFLDPPTGEVLAVPPAPGRVVLLDQDISHSVTAPNPAAGERPRYSLVLKCVMHPRAGPTQRVALARDEWGAPLCVGSAAAPPPGGHAGDSST